MRTILIFATGLCGLLLAGCGQRVTPPPASQATAPSGPERIASAHLPNAYRLHERVISGGQPDGEEAFRELAALGVKTVISVDGARPEVELARKYGLRYVHLPHGYDGIPDSRVMELAKAVRELDGPLYIHCHHGEHRSPAAAAAACVTAGYLPPKDAVGILKTAGTSDHYLGLYEAAEKARPLDAGELKTLKVEYRETADLPPLAEIMVQIEHIFDRLRKVDEAGWRPPADHPDVDPPHEALLLREQYTELLRAPEVSEHPAEFSTLLKRSETAAQALENSLRNWKASGGRDPAPTVIGASFKELKTLCTSCHTDFRDVPLSEKWR